jgi:F-type H+-transporting ATPase subunit b
VKNQIGNMVIEVAEKVIRRELAPKAEQDSYIHKLADDLISIRNANN